MLFAMISFDGKVITKGMLGNNGVSIISGGAKIMYLFKLSISARIQPVKFYIRFNVQFC